MKTRLARFALTLCLSLGMLSGRVPAATNALRVSTNRRAQNNLARRVSPSASRTNEDIRIHLRKSALSADGLPPDSEENFLSPPEIGSHTLRILSPTILELCLVTTKKPDGPVEQWDFVGNDGTLRLPSASQFRVLINESSHPSLVFGRGAGRENHVLAVGFKRRVLYAPLKKRDLRIGNYLYLRLARPIPDDSTVEVQNPDWTLWPATEQYAARMETGRWSPAIHVNQVGYMPTAVKKAMVGYYLGSLGELDLPAGSRFGLIDSNTNKMVYSGELKARLERGWTYSTQPYQHVLEADFSAFHIPGAYRLSVPGLGASLPFRINEGTAAVYARTYALGLYHQRCGAANALPFTRFVHAPCHIAPAEVPTMENKSVQRQLSGESSNYKDNPRHTAPQLKDVNSTLYPFVRQGKVDVSGGHHDAGDYSKYTINSAQLIHTLIFAADNFPGAVSLDNLGLPESGDGKSDLLQIAKWEADFLAKMQDEDGGFYFLVYPRNRAYENDVLPDAGDPQVVFPKTTSVTAAAVAALAQTASSPQFKKTFPAVAARYLRKALKGWDFLEHAWAKYGMDGSYQKITHYGDVFMHNDEIAWAAAELYLATGEPKYHEKLHSLFDPSDKNTLHWNWERMFEAYGCAARSYAFAESSGRMTRRQLDPVYLEKCRQEILAAAQDHQDWAGANAYGTSFPIESKRFRTAGWYFSASQAFDIAVADLIAPRSERAEAIWGNLNFEAGCNPSNVVFLTGLGWKRQTEIVHQYAMNDPRTLPPDGIPLGSIQEGFMYLDAYKGELGALSFPPDGKQDRSYPFYDRWGDSFNVATEFTIPIQGRCLAVSAWLMARSSLKEQRWRAAEAHIIGVPDHARVGKPLTLTLKVEGLALKDAQIVWEGQEHKPKFGFTFNFRSESAGKQWIEAECQWPDGRRAFAVAEFNASNIPLRAEALKAFAASDVSNWQSNLRKVHSRFTGRKGTFAHFGDSITDTMAFWAPLQYERKNASPGMVKAFEAVNAYQRPECWRDWKGPEYGNQGGQTTEWALKNVDGWLKKLNPEVALILFGTNDMRSIEVEEYTRNLRRIVQKCLDNGTAVILTTVPPRHGFDKKAADFAKAARQVAMETSVPLIDFYSEILKRHPDDWDGALDKFSAYKDYNVPTLIARDGVHPSSPQKYQNDYSDEALRSSGYILRNYLTLMQYAEVVAVLSGKTEPKTVSLPLAGKDERTTLHPPEQPWFPKAPRRPPPSGEIIRVASAEDLYAAADRVKPGGTILIADGFYELSRPLEIKTDRVAVRGESGHRERVILDAKNHGELLRITACTGVTIADLTVQNVQWNGIKINSETNVQKLTIYNCLLHNIWQRAIKGVKVPEKDRDTIRPSSFRIQYCLFYNDHPKQFSDDDADTDQNFHGNYIGGIDAMYPRDWIISDNVFIGIHGKTREARGAVFLWHDVRNCIIERNIVIDCDSGICLGNSFRPEDIMIHCTGCIVRNNFITRASENGILADYTRDCKILNNTIWEPESKLGRLIRLVHDNDGLLVANNLVCGPPIRIESQSKILFRGNVEKDLSATLVNPSAGNLHLTERAVEAIDKAVPLPDVKEDIDHSPRGSKPDVGAHEFRQ